MGSQPGSLTIYAPRRGGAGEGSHPLRARVLGGGAFRIEEAPSAADPGLGPGDEVLCELERLCSGETGWVVRRRIDRGWSVWREDDHGRRFEVDRALSHDAAHVLAARLESGGHKQRYWIAPSGEAQ